jgi:DNA-binding transcriptional ArsR family regulator
VPRFEDEPAVLQATPAAIVRRDLLATYAPDPVPNALAPVARRGEKAVAALRDRICDELERYWRLAVAPTWPQMRLVLAADTTYRARQLAVAGARLLFADMHPNLRWRNGVLEIDEMISEHTVQAAGRGLLLMPSIFAVKPSAVSQHLRVLHATGLVTRARDRRLVLYRRSPIGDQLVTGA